ncbi:MAG: nuclear transport factor 2 family protein [Acidobacteria bacterium]|nr:nuclear transport factor 2 family protein [Acidobacteriota bacterium]MBW4044476.1 nuclear transport factor 2 family protein [Acidobacteriota bacterium]
MQRPASFRKPLKATGACLLLLLFGMCALSMPAHAAMPHRENRAQKEVEALEAQWRTAQITNDVKTMDRLLADDYIGISANGTIETKAEILAQHRSGTLQIKQLDFTDTKVRVYGDTAVVTSRAELTGTNGESDVSGEYRYTRVYNRRFGQWKIVSFEASHVHDASSRSKH